LREQQPDKGNRRSMTQSAEPNRRSPVSRWLGRWEGRDVAPLVSLAVLVVFFSVATPSFLSFFTWSQVLRQGSAMAIVAVGLTFVLICAEIDLAVGMMALWAACLCGWLLERWAGGADASAGQILVVLAVPLLSCLLLGVFSGLLTVWTRLPSFIISLAMMFITEGMARFLTKSQMFRVPAVLSTVGNGDDLAELLGYFSGSISWLGGLAGLGVPAFDPTPWLGRWRFPFNAILAAVVFALGYVVLQHTRFGRYVYMTGGSREAARLAGVRTGRIVVACLAVSAVTAGLGGMLNAGRLGNVTLDQNKDLLLSAVACVVLGGTSLFGGEGGMGKTVIGVFTYTVLNVGLSQVLWINDLARQLLTGIVLMAALVVNGVLARRS